MPQDTATLQLPPLRDAVIGASRSILRYGLKADMRRCRARILTSQGWARPTDDRSQPKADMICAAATAGSFRSEGGKLLFAGGG